MCHSPKVEDEVENFFVTPLTHIEYQLSADIHSHKVGTKYQEKLQIFLVGPK